jgi:hypothetical protein
VGGGEEEFLSCWKMRECFITGGVTFRQRFNICPMDFDQRFSCCNELYVDVLARMEGEAMLLSSTQV